MPTCFVPKCSNKHIGKNPQLSFHSFPKQREAIWLKAICRDENTAIIQQRICSDHFKAEDFEHIGVLKKLKPNTVPTLNLPVSLSFNHAGTSKTWKKLTTTVEPKVEPIEEFESLTKRTCSRNARSLSPQMANTSEPSAVTICVKPTLKRKLEQGISTYTSGRKLRFQLVDSSGLGRFDHFTAPTPGTSFNASKSSTGIKTKAKRADTLHSSSHSPKHNVKRIKNKYKHTRYMNGTLKIYSRRKRKTLSLQGIVNHLKYRFSLSPDAIIALENTFEGISMAEMKRMINNLRAKARRPLIEYPPEINNSRRKGQHIEYPPEIQSFAMTLQFYSAQAYNYLRSTFDLPLPAPSTIRAWFSKKDCSPGFSKPSFDSLKIRAHKYLRKNNRQLICALMFGLMAIKKEIIFEKGSRNIWGYNDVGSNIQDTDNQEQATEALVLMVVAVNDSFKFPIGYFFISKLNAEEQANVIREALIHLYDTGIKIVSVTCNGPSVHFKMIKELGCNISSSNSIKSYFNHPLTDQKVFVLFDTCHMLKLLRINWANLGIFIDPDGNHIKWEYIKKLDEIQQDEQRYLGNSLSKQHIMEWKQVILKVKLAAQSLSSSVADALEFLAEDLKLEEFKDAEPTIKFIRTIAKLFDLLNSRNLFGRGMNTPMKKWNKHWKSFLEGAVDYILGCKNVEGVLLRRSIKKAPFIGFAVSSLSLLQIYREEVIDKKSLDYILTYKFNQDHLELFFCSIRSLNGWRNNPNCIEFMHSYRTLLLHQDIGSNIGECIAQDQANIITVSSSKQKLEITNIHVSRIREEVAAERENKINIFLPIEFGEFTENVISYLSGFVIKMLMKRVKCPICLEALVFSADIDCSDSRFKLIYSKSRRALLLPSQSLREVCRVTEKKLQILMRVHGQIPQKHALSEFLVIEAHRLLWNTNLFSSLTYHCFDVSISETNHKQVLIDEIIQSYATIRIDNLAERINENMSGTKLRNMITKLIFYKHQ